MDFQIESIRPGLSKADQMAAAAAINKAASPGVGAEVPHPGTAPARGATPATLAAHQAKLDQHVEYLLTLPGTSWSAEQRATVLAALRQWEASGRADG